MAFRSVGVSIILLLTALALCAADGPQNDSAARTDKAQQSSLPQNADAVATGTQATAPAPTLSQMRAMTGEQLDAEGDRLREMKDYLSALDCYHEAVHKHATADYYNKIAITELLLRHPAEAVKAAKKAVRKDKTLAEAWNNLGVTYYMQHKYDAAIQYYKRALSLKPESASFHNNLAAAYMDSKQFERGMAEYRKAIELDPSFFEHVSQNGISAHMSSPQDRAQFSFVMAKLFAANGDLERSLHYLRSAMEDGYPKIDEVYRDKEFAHVVKDERFLALMKDRPVAIRQ